MKRWFERSPAVTQSAPSVAEHGDHDDIRVPSLSLQLAATPDAAALMRHRVTAFAGENGATLEVRSRIGSAVTEAVANAVVHAYPNREGAVTCDCDVEHGALEVIIADRGDGFRPGDSSGLGIGLAIVAGCCDHFWIHQGDEEPGVAVWMRFALV